MLQWRNNPAALNALAQAAAISKSQAVIEFNWTAPSSLPTRISSTRWATRSTEIQDKHHRMFVEPAERESAEYRAFWARLNRGEFQAAEYKRIAKGGREVWIQASYNPILTAAASRTRSIKFATDITAQKIPAWKMPARSRRSAAPRR